MVTIIRKYITLILHAKYEFNIVCMFNDYFLRRHYVNHTNDHFEDDLVCNLLFNDRIMTQIAVEATLS